MGHIGEQIARGAGSRRESFQVSAAGREDRTGAGVITPYVSPVLFLVYQELSPVFLCTSRFEVEDKRVA